MVICLGSDEKRKHARIHPQGFDKFKLFDALTEVKDGMLPKIKLIEDKLNSAELAQVKKRSSINSRNRGGNRKSGEAGEFMHKTHKVDGVV